MTAPSADVLDAVTVPVPCTVPWESMTGDDRVRWCRACRLHVHDLSAMPRDEAVAFLTARAASGERICGRFRRRPDGRVVTDDCVGVARAIRRRARIAAAAVVGALGAAGFAWARSAADGRSLDDPDLWERQPFRTLAKVLPDAWLPSRAPALLGEIALPSPAAGTGDGG